MVFNDTRATTTSVLHHCVHHRSLPLLIIVVCLVLFQLIGQEHQTERQQWKQLYLKHLHQSPVEQLLSTNNNNLTRLAAAAAAVVPHFLASNNHTNGAKTTSHETIRSVSYSSSLDDQYNNNNNNSNSIVSTNNNSSTSTSNPWNIQVFVVTAAGKEAYRARYLANSELWHRDFPTLQSYTFDELEPDDPLLSTVHVIPKIKQEESQSNNWNLLLASIKSIYEHNPNASWYFLAEDDTIVIKQNLERYIQMRMTERPELRNSTGPTIENNNNNNSMTHTATKNQEPASDSSKLYNNYYYEGKCVSLTFRNQPLPFIMGGPGILFSQGLMKALVPHVMRCRKKYHGYGDSRIAKCMKHYGLLLDDFTCSQMVAAKTAAAAAAVADTTTSNTTNTTTPYTMSKQQRQEQRQRQQRQQRRQRQEQGFRFSSASAWWEMEQNSGLRNDALVVSLHEKDPHKIRFLNSIIFNLTKQQIIQSDNTNKENNTKSIDITYATMKPYLQQYQVDVS